MSTNKIATIRKFRIARAYERSIMKENMNSTPAKCDPIKILILTTFPPRECGIATYSSDLVNNLKKIYGNSITLEICPLIQTDHLGDYPKNFNYFLNTESETSYLELSNKVNLDDSIDLILIQHEFGLFNTNSHIFVQLLKSIKKKKILEFHTVLPNPNAKFLNYVKLITSNVHHILVMTESSKNILNRAYKVDTKDVSVIYHGTHLVPFKDEMSLKKKYGLHGKTVLSTFGLLGPGKSIETTLDALPELLKNYPDLIFMVLGKTHPSLVEKEGENYREFLIQKTKELEITEHVKFVNEFLPLNELLEYLQLTDVYLFTSKDPNQAVSGTFSYAMSCGCAILSTPIPHAKEFLTEDKGKIFNFGDSKMLAHHLNILLENPSYRKALGLNNLHASAATSWENSAISHGNIFNNFIANKSLKLHKPALMLNHLRTMTTNVGIVQFSQLNRPDISSGYTLDDNARALVAACDYYELTKDKNIMVHLEIYFNFILSCQQNDGTFLNYVDEKGKFTTQNDLVNLEDSNGRAIWALGRLIQLKSKLPDSLSFLIIRAEESFDKFEVNIPKYNSPRALAFIIKGIYGRFATDINFKLDVKSIVKKLVEMYHHETDTNWKWFESYMTYGNSVLPEALLLAYGMTNEEQFKKIALNSFDFLLSQLFDSGEFTIISNQTWLKKGGSVADIPKGGQQPIDVAYTILALKTFHYHFPNLGYNVKMENAFRWFLGQNHLNQTVYNHLTKGCHDGIEEHNINLNQGAESTISYLLARMAFE